MKKIMAIGAHPDDIEFGCGGTIYRHATQNDFVIYVCMTSTESVDGVTGEIIRTKEQNTSEVMKSANILRCNVIEHLPFTDLKVPFNFESVSKLESLIKRYEIDTIYTHWAGDANQDHIATFKTTMAAARYVPNVLCYEQIPISRISENNIDVHYYVNITECFDIKIEAAACHESQIIKYRNVGFDVCENLKILASFRGIQAQCKYAEAFKVLKTVI